MSAFFQFSSSLAKKDFTFFHRLFCQEINLLLPVSGAVFFWEQSGNWLPKKRAEEMLGQGYARLSALCASLEPAVIENVLVLPVIVEGGGHVAVIIGDIDSGLLRKMSPEWLRELRDNVQDALVQAKQAYIYPETGLYSIRLLKMIWDELGDKSGAFFLIGTPDRTRRSSQGLMKVMQTACMLEATMSGPVFYFGGKVFGVYQGNLSRDSALHFAHRLLGRLKREGAHYVHIGIALVQEHEENSLVPLLDDCWHALETAEQRGPFSLCEASFLPHRHIHPLAPPVREIVNRLQYKWRKLNRFSILLLRVEWVDEKDKGERVPLARRLTENYQGKYTFVSVNSSECYLLLPGISAKKALLAARSIKDKLDGVLQPNQLAIGLSDWPCLGLFKRATLVNCRKALMHGDFFGPGSITLFDHVSLNVSGDYFFEEGDYRQAVKDYKAGLKMNPGEVNLLNSLGVALTELNRLVEAVSCFDLVLEKETKNFMALVNKGFALRMLKKEEGALACLSQAVTCQEFSSSPVSTDISLQLGRLYCARGQYEHAVTALEQMKSQGSETTRYLLCSLLGEAYAATGRHDKAISILQEAIRYNPHDAQSMSILGYLYGIEGQGDDIALSLCTQAVNIDDLAWGNWFRLAKVRFKMADYDGSLAAVKESLLKNRTAVDAIFLAGNIFAKHGNTKQAKRMFQRVLRIVPNFPGASRALQEIM